MRHVSFFGSPWHDKVTAWPETPWYPQLPLLCPCHLRNRSYPKQPNTHSDVNVPECSMHALTMCLGQSWGIFVLLEQISSSEAFLRTVTGEETVILGRVACSCSGCNLPTPKLVQMMHTLMGSFLWDALQSISGKLCQSTPPPMSEALKTNKKKGFKTGAEQQTLCKTPLQHVPISTSVLCY